MPCTVFQADSGILISDLFTKIACSGVSDQFNMPRMLTSRYADLYKKNKKIKNPTLPNLLYMAIWSNL